MIIHTNAPAAAIYNAASGARAHVTVEQRGSRTHDHAFHVVLTGGASVHSKRRAMRPPYGASDAFAATWDQWGTFLAAVFRADQEARCGSAKRPDYADGRDFHLKTNGRFGQPGLPADYHGDHSWVPGGRTEGTHCKKCSAVDLRWVV